MPRHTCVKTVKARRCFTREKKKTHTHTRGRVVRQTHLVEVEPDAAVEERQQAEDVQLLGDAVDLEGGGRREYMI